MKFETSYNAEIKSLTAVFLSATALGASGCDFNSNDKVAPIKTQNIPTAKGEPKVDIDFYANGTALSTVNINESVGRATDSDKRDHLYSCIGNALQVSSGGFYSRSGVSGELHEDSKICADGKVTPTDFGIK